MQLRSQFKVAPHCSRFNGTVEITRSDLVEYSDNSLVY